MDKLWKAMDKVIITAFVVVVIVVIASLLYGFALNIEASVMCTLYGYDSGYATIMLDKMCVDTSGVMPSAIPLEMALR